MKRPKEKSIVKTLPAYVARKNFGELLEEVYYRGDCFIIERAGKPMAKIIPLDEGEKETLAKEQGKDVYERIQARARRIRVREVERDVEEAVKAVRSKSWAKSKQ